MDTESDAIDRRVLNRLRKIGGDALLSNIVSLFVSHAEPTIRKATAGFEVGDLESVQWAAHSLKSSAGNLGAQQLQNLAGMIEQLAEDQRAEEIQPLLAELEKVYLRAKARLAEETS